MLGQQAHEFTAERAGGPGDDGDRLSHGATLPVHSWLTAAMPTIRYQLVQGLHTDAELRELLTRSCVLFAETLEVPADRIRAFADEVRPQAAAIGGQLVAEGATEAPFFEFVLFAGRPLEHGQQLMAGFTDLLVECLGSERSLIRGRVTFVDPDHWSIAGVPASEVRRADIEARAAAQQSS